MLRSLLFLFLASMVSSWACAQTNAEISVSKLQNLTQMLQEDLQSGKVEGVHIHLLQLHFLLEILQEQKEASSPTSATTYDLKATYAKLLNLTVDPNEKSNPALTVKLVPLGEAVQAAVDASDLLEATTQATQLRLALNPIRSAQLDAKVRQSFAVRPDSGSKDLMQHVYNLHHALQGNDLETAGTLASETFTLLEHPDESVSEMMKRRSFEGLIGEAKYLAYSALGRIAVQNADYENAQKYLLASAVGPKSNPTKGFGPNMKLAQALLQHGYNDTVIQYLTTIKSYWKSSKPEEWINDINNSRMPLFGANLFY